MANGDSIETSLDQRTRLEGAKAALMALLQLKVAAAEESEQLDLEWDDYWQARRAAADAVVRASGVTSPFLAGFIAALAEHVDFCNTTGLPNLSGEGWRPLAAMTGGEFAACRRTHETEAAA